MLDGFCVDAAKTGMLFSSDIMEALVPLLEKRRFPLVVDPVCVSTSGHRLLREDAVETLKTRIVPLADLLTPNRHEAELLAGMPIAGEADVAEAGKRIINLGAKAVLIKGGHFAENPIMVTDWLIERDCDPVPLRQPHIGTPNTHGTGCTLSAAIATWLGFEMPLRVAVTRAQEYLNKGLVKSYAPGEGFGPPNHMAWK